FSNQSQQEVDGHVLFPTVTPNTAQRRRSIENGDVVRVSSCHLARLSRPPQNPLEGCGGSNVIVEGSYFTLSTREQGGMMVAGYIDEDELLNIPSMIEDMARGMQGEKGPTLPSQPSMTTSSASAAPPVSSQRSFSSATNATKAITSSISDLSFLPFPKALGSAPLVPIVTPRNQNKKLLKLINQLRLKVKRRRVHRAGPREKIYYKPKEVKAAIVTSGDLCPGLNDVDELVVQAFKFKNLSNEGRKRNQIQQTPLL
ncbi:hypothetical protein S83_070328, partial [Arachis hypogaea]